MQPKPIDSISVLDVDHQRRVVSMEGFAAHLRALRESKENPGETDYDVSHDEESHRDGEETSRQSSEKLKQMNHSDETEEPGRKDSSEDKGTPVKGPKGSRLDIEG